jgi:cystathionine beta-lyase/cystathionine gamma-synthase
MTHASIDKSIRDSLGISDSLLRLSIGIEDVTDIQNDLEEALQQI